MQPRATGGGILGRILLGTLSAIILALSLASIREVRGGGAYERETPYRDLVEAYEKRNLPEKAMRAYTSLLQGRSPSYGRVYYGVGEVYRGMGKPQEALGAYKEALRIQPDSPLLYFSLGIAYDDLGRYDEAVHVYERALTLDPNYIKAYNNLAVIYVKKEMYDKALVTLKAAVGRDSTHFRLHRNLADLYLKKKDYRNAAETLEYALEINPDFAVGWVVLGRVHVYHLKDTTKGLYCLRRALEIDPDMPQVGRVKATIEHLEAN